MRVAVLLLLCFACNTRIVQPHVAVFSTVEPLMRGDTTRTGFFTTSTLFDTSYDMIAYETTRGRVLVPNDGTQNFLLCRYDTATMQPVWIAAARGTGGDGGCNYFVIPPENSVYVMGYFEDTAYFPHVTGHPACDTLVSRGYADMFVAKYDYTTGELIWITSGGSKYTDIVFMLSGERHQDTYMYVDSSAVTVYANFFGPAYFGGTILNAKLGGEAICIRYNKVNGEVLDIGHPFNLPNTDVQ